MAENVLGNPDRPKKLFCFPLFLLLIFVGSVQAQYSVGRQWNEELLGAIRADLARPTIHARNLFHTAAAMWDAWAAYDGSASPYLFNASATASIPGDARNEAISYAAYRLLSWRFANSPGAASSLQSFDDRMVALGYDLNFTAIDGNSPAALGNRIAAAYISLGLNDGANEAGGYDNFFYLPVNPPRLN